MAFIKLFDFKNSSGLLKKEYEKGLRRAGRIWNVLTIQSQTPEILRESMRLYNSTMFGNSNVPRFDRELLAVVTSISNECEYWIRAHLYDLRSETDNQKLVDEVADNWRESSLSEKQKAICFLAEKLTLSPGKIDVNDINEVKKFGYTDKEISEIVQIISFFNYINRVADGLGLEPEEFIDSKGYKK